jgi:hypothetical protein
MKRLFMISLAAIGLATGAPADDKPPLEVKPTGTPGKVAGSRTKTTTATVTAVDLVKRTITLQPEKGVAQTIRVGDEVKRLDEIAPGDKIVIEVSQGLLLEAQLPGSAPATPASAAVAERAGASEPPGGVGAAAVQTTVTITAIDMANRMVVVQAPEGNVYQLRVGPEVRLDRAKVGDKFLATYSQSVAISVKKAETVAPAKKKPDSAK